MFSIITSILQIDQNIKNHVYLIPNDWDDWFSFETTYTVIIYDAGGKKHTLGTTKIGEANLHARSRSGEREIGFRSPTLQNEFPELSEHHFTLGQDDNYYETLNSLDNVLRKKILLGLRDCAYDLSIFNKYEKEPVMNTSLLRHITSENVCNRLHRLANGNAELSRYEFEYIFPSEVENVGQGGVDINTPPRLSFSVEPESRPATNVHVLIGRNGVGKTRCVQSLTRTILGQDGDEKIPVGNINRLGENKNDWSFAGLVLVSFSVFDEFAIPNTDKFALRATLVGLRHEDGDNIVVKTPQMLAKDFSDSFGRCRSGLRAERWLDALRTLETDHLFEEADISRLLELEDDDWEETAQKLFRHLSSGHAIVLLTTTRLVELVDERTLVILDEPEGHLHPPLLSAFIRAVTDLLIKRNGVGIIATHSPVVLQETPACCVWKLERHGRTSIATRPKIETFGENVGVLTREVFGLEVTDSGFHSVIRKSVNSGFTYDEIIEKFDGQLGMEARIITRNMLASMQANKA